MSKVIRDFISLTSPFSPESDGHLISPFSITFDQMQFKKLMIVKQIHLVVNSGNEEREREYRY